MEKKTLNTIVLVVGIAILVVCLFADSLGIGDSPGFGRDQAIGSAVGAIVTAAGIILTIKAR